jgi:FkbM family methyltransferase
MLVNALVRKAVTLVPYSLRGRVKSLPLLGTVQRYVVDKQLNGRPFVHTVDAGPSKGISYELTLPEDKGIWTGNYEPQFAKRLAAEMKPGMVGYDIGAWHGFFTGIMMAGGAGKVVMFEPLPENRARLERFLALNPGHDLTIRPEALGDRQGTANLTQMEESSMAKLADSPFEPENTKGQQIVVALDTMDAMVGSGALPPPDIIKIDVEGAEAMVLRGAIQTLSTARPIVLAEIHSGELLREVTELLEGQRYVVEAIDASELHRAADAGHICARPIG